MDISGLLGLPDAVKRRILKHVEDTDATASTGEPDDVWPMSDVRDAPLLVVDGFLPEPLIQVSAYLATVRNQNALLTPP